LPGHVPTQLVPVEQVEGLIHLARGEKVLLDADLAKLYGVETKALNKAVKRNRRRFPEDFMFQLTPEEAGNLRCQIGTSSSGYGGRRYLPYAFTEQGVAMLSSVLRSERAVQVNVAIMRAFVSLRRMLAGNEALARKLAELERRLEGHDQSIRSLFDAIRGMIDPGEKTAPGNRLPRERGYRTLPREAKPTMPREYQNDGFLSHRNKEGTVVKTLPEEVDAGENSSSGPGTPKL
jgi:hypothetical protein